MEKHWDLTNIYPAPDSPEFEKDLALASDTLKKAIASIKNGKATVEQIVKGTNFLTDLIETMESYAYTCYSVNTSDKVAVNAMNKVEALGMDQAVFSTLSGKFIAQNSDEVKAFCNKNPEYSYVLSEIAESAKHQMSPEMEELASDLMRSGSDSYQRLQEAVSSSSCADFDGEKKSVIELRALATCSDRKVRQKAYEAELSVWKEHEVSFAYALNGIKGTVLSLEERRNWASPIERSCSDARINEKILNALIGTIEKNLPMFRRYFLAKAKLLGLEKMAFFDLFAPVGNTPMTFTLEQARKIVSDNYGTFNPQMKDFALNAFDQNWIDPYPAKGKAGGAYDIYFPKVGQSRVFANFDGTYDGVSTFAHELGHAWHDHVLVGKPGLLRRYPMTLAETASIFSEFIVFKGITEHATDDEKLTLIEQFLQGASQVCVDILCRFYFERETFKRRKNGEIMASEFCSIMLDCQKATYGEGLDENFLHPYMWAVKGHYYSTGFSFYNYPYAFGQLFGLGLYSRASHEGKGVPFCEKYNKLLSLTGQLPAADVAKTAGIDLEDPAFWQEGLDIIASYVSEFEKLASR